MRRRRRPPVAVAYSIHTMKLALPWYTHAANGSLPNTDSRARGRKAHGPQERRKSCLPWGTTVPSFRGRSLSAATARLYPDSHARANFESVNSSLHNRTYPWLSRSYSPSPLSFPSGNSCRHAGVNNLALYRVGRDGRIQTCYADLYRPWTGALK